MSGLLMALGFWAVWVVFYRAIECLGAAELSELPVYDCFGWVGAPELSGRSRSLKLRADKI